ncbi:MAG TPA: 50S ribosomal protein L21, partial [Anaerolineales bacterium]|nr:50S ribosomal protein L21 [Anaerolineales bacterium]
MKYAIVESGGKQYKAVEGKTIEVDLMPLEVGNKVELSDVLLISDEGNIMIGTPNVADAKVNATVVAQIKAPKVTVFKYKSRQRYRVKQGHRQKYTRLEIDEIIAKGVSKKA